MNEWIVGSRELKRYPHFDKYLPPSEIEAIVKNPDRVRTNRFFPFMLYEKRFTPFRLNGKPKKIRKIRYASRRDSNIFSYYRHMLAKPYETELQRLGLSDSVIAYRKIASDCDGRGKCNIHFARDAFDLIAALGDCSAVALDISSYFENIDHDRLRELWCRMLMVNNLPPDHATVFRNITNYAVVDRQKVYERLGFFGTTTKSGKSTPGYLIPFHKMPMQLCTPQEFREKIIGGSDKLQTLIEKNTEAFGIPQGAPISDLLANLYLLDFDTEMKAYAQARGGVYLRYSDDILFVLPGGKQVGTDALDHAVSRIKHFGSQLEIKPQKSSIVRYWRDLSGKQHFEHVYGVQGRNGLEYLGFRFDGRKVYLRDSTVSGFYRKITLAARAAAHSHVARYQGKDLAFLLNQFDYRAFTSRFGRVEEFDQNDDYRTWTFWTYAKRAAEAFGKPGRPILDQIKQHKSKIKERLEREIARALSASATATF